MPQAAGKVIAGCFALTAFAVAVLAGLFAGNPMLEILTRALIIMCICYPVGFLVGLAIDHVIAQHVREHAEANPAPDTSSIDGSEPREALAGAVAVPAMDGAEEIIEV
ncbi:MAG: hypothetical protein AAF432_12210 [Planctomycetota bacterium]